MKKTTKSSMVLPTPVADIRQTKTMLTKDRSARIGAKPKSSRPNAVRSKKHLAWYVALNTKQLEKKFSSIPQIKWKCPPKFVLHTGWHVASGEGSEEADVQKCRETAVVEAVYTDLTAIRPSPFNCPLMESDGQDNCGTPIIPIIPIEEVDAEMPLCTSATVNTSINPQPLASSCPLVSESLPFSQCDPSESQDQPVHGVTLPNVLHGLGSDDMEIAAAAAATVAAAMQREGQIDTELLIKFLTDAEMVKKLLNGNGLICKPEDEDPPALKPETCLPLPSLEPESAVDKLALSKKKAVLSKSTLQVVIRSPDLPCSRAESETNNLASKLGGMHSGTALTHTSKVPKRTSPSPRLDSDKPTKNLTFEHGGPASSCIDEIAQEQKVRPLMHSLLRPDKETIDRWKCGGPISLSTSNPNIAVKRMIHDYRAPDVAQVTQTSKAAKRTSPPVLYSDRPTKKLTFEHGGLASLHIDPIAREQKVTFRPLLLSTLRPDEETIDGLITRYGGPNVTGFKPVNPLNLTTSKPNMDAAKKMIHDYGTPEVARVKPMAPLVPHAAMSSDMEDIDRTAEKYLLSEHGLVKPLTGPSHPWLASTVTPPLENLHALPNAVQSHPNATGTFHPSFPPMTLPNRQMDLQYHKSLITQHGVIHETWEDKFPKTFQSGNYLQGLELGHKVNMIEMNQNYQKPCLYFSSSEGCRNGYSCLYQHDVSKQWRAAGAVEAPAARVAGKMKLIEQFGKWP